MNDIVEVLMYLFHNYMDGAAQIDRHDALLLHELGNMGFTAVAINRAFNWLDGLTDWQKQASALSTGNDAQKSIMRIYNDDENCQLNARCRGFLLELEQKGILNELSRELVIDRLLAFNQPKIEVKMVKWVALLVLFNQGDKARLACMERLVLSNEHEYARLH